MVRPVPLTGSPSPRRRASTAEPCSAHQTRASASFQTPTSPPREARGAHRRCAGDRAGPCQAGEHQLLEALGQGHAEALGQGHAEALGPRDRLGAEVMAANPDHGLPREDVQSRDFRPPLTAAYMPRTICPSRQARAEHSRGRSQMSMRWSVALCAGALILASGCSLLTSLDGWTFHGEDAAMMDAGAWTRAR